MVYKENNPQLKKFKIIQKLNYKMFINNIKIKFQKLIVIFKI